MIVKTSIGLTAYDVLVMHKNAHGRTCSMNIEVSTACTANDALILHRTSSCC